MNLGDLLWAIHCAGMFVHSLVYRRIIQNTAWELRPIENGGLGLTPSEYVFRDWNFLRLFLFILFWPLVVAGNILLGAYLGLRELYR